MFTGRRFGGTPRIGWPPMRISPASGAVKPAIMRSSVVLPQPEGPRIEKKLPRATSNDKRLDGDVAAEALDDAIDLRSGVSSPALGRSPPGVPPRGAAARS